jgi:drug/metabolite transporter (DMT)-like permease
MMKFLQGNNPVLIGAAFAVAQSIMFAFMGLFVKLATDIHHPVEAMFFRSFVCLILCTITLRSIGKLYMIKSANLRNQMIRGVVGSIGMVLTFFALKMLPLSEIQSLLFAAPIFVVLLSYPLLKEKVGIYRIAAAMAGFCGILLIVQPGAISSFAGGMVGIAAAFFHALIMVILRWLGKSEEPFVTVFYFSLISSVLVIPALPFFFTMPSLYSLFLLVMIGVCAFALQICLTKSYIYADATIIAPITYLNMLWALLLDFFVWGFVPGAMVVAGAAIIIISNFVIILRESKKKKRPAPEISS